MRSSSWSFLLMESHTELLTSEQKEVIRKTDYTLSHESICNEKREERSREPSESVLIVVLADFFLGRKSILSCHTEANNHGIKSMCLVKAQGSEESKKLGSTRVDKNLSVIWGLHVNVGKSQKRGKTDEWFIFHGVGWGELSQKYDEEEQIKGDTSKTTSSPTASASNKGRICNTYEWGFAMTN